MTRPASPASRVVRTALPVLILLAALALLINVLSGRGAAPTPEAFAGAPSLDEALSRAATRDRLVFAVATADWCPPCQQYKRNALADPRVAAWLEGNAVPVLIDVTDGPNDASNRLGVRGIPASFVLDADGDVLAQWVGSLDAPDVLGRLEHAGRLRTAETAP